jgi:hypothetical protein
MWVRTTQAGSVLPVARKKVQSSGKQYTSGNERQPPLLRVEMFSYEQTTEVWEVDSESGQIQQPYQKHVHLFIYQLHFLLALLTPFSDGSKLTRS